MVRYLLAIVTAMAALGLRFVLTPLLGAGNPYHTVWLGVVFCAWFCGVGPAIVATLIMVTGVLYWFVLPFGLLRPESPREIFGVLGFLLFAAIIITIGERARRVQMKLNEAHDEMEAAVKQRTEELAEANHKLQELSSRLLQMQDAERRRFARDLHDSVGQLLAVIGMNLVAFQREQLSPAAAQLLRESYALVDEISGQIRTISHLLHPPLLDEAGLASALRVYVEGFAQRSKTEARLEVAEELPRLAQELEISIFRIVQECLTNIHKHAGASRVVVQVTQDSERVTVSVKDDGKGMKDGNAPGIGLTGMQERVRQSKGTFKVASGPQGTTVTASFPVTGAATESTARTDSQG